MNKDLVAAVERFHSEVLGMGVPPFPTPLHPNRKAWAVTAMMEELVEFRDSTEMVDEADALADLVYFALGRSLEMGFDFYPVFAEVHRANMDKKRGELAKRPGSMGYDAVKPEGWRGPNHFLYGLQRINSNPKVLVIGHARHGKDTVAEMLRDDHGFAFQSSSMYVAEHVVFPRLRLSYTNFEECYNDRVNHRHEWREIIREYTSNDGARVGRMILQNNDVYCGVRAVEEFEAIKAESLVDHVIWVDGSKRHGPDSTCSVRPEMADFIIDNNGTPYELRLRVDTVAGYIKGTY